MKGMYARSLRTRDVPDRSSLREWRLRSEWTEDALDRITAILLWIFGREWRVDADCRCEPNLFVCIVYTYYTCSKINTRESNSTTRRFNQTLWNMYTKMYTECDRSIEMLNEKRCDYQMWLVWWIPPVRKCNCAGSRICGFNRYVGVIFYSCTIVFSTLVQISKVLFILSTILFMIIIGWNRYLFALNVWM